MKKGDLGFFYHTGEEKAVVGIVEVIGEYQLDPTDETGVFGLVVVKAVKDMPKPVTLAVEFDGASRTPWGEDRVGFSAATELDREDWGLTWNQALETGGVVVGKKVRIELSVEAVRRDGGGES